MNAGTKKNIEINIDYVKTLSIETLQEYALKYLTILDKKKQWNRKYNALPNIKIKQRIYYYKKHNIYHPDYNPEGLIEKRLKKKIN